MQYITWILRVFLFLVLFLFALKNYEVVPLKFYFDLEWRAPMVLLLLIFFAAGMGLGVVACLPRLFRQRRELTAVAAARKRAGPAAAPAALVPDAPADALTSRGPAIPGT
jgi:putative membrane protein